MVQVGITSVRAACKYTEQEYSSILLRASSSNYCVCYGVINHSLNDRCAHQLKLFSGHLIVAVPAMSFFSRVRDFGPLKFLMSKTVTAGATQRVQQEQLDLYRAAVLLRGHDWFVQNSAKEGGSQISVQPTEADIERFYHDIDQLRPKAVQSLVQKSVDLQLRNMFSKLDDYATAIGKMKERRHHSQPIEPFTTLRESLGFELKCKTSSIPNAGLVR